MADRDVPKSRLGRLARLGLGGLSAGAKMIETTPEPITMEL